MLVHAAYVVDLSGMLNHDESPAVMFSFDRLLSQGNNPIECMNLISLLQYEQFVSLGKIFIYADERRAGQGFFPLPEGFIRSAFPDALWEDLFSNYYPLGERLPGLDYLDIIDYAVDVGRLFSRSLKEDMPNQGLSIGKVNALRFYDYITELEKVIETGYH